MHGRPAICTVIGWVKISRPLLVWILWDNVTTFAVFTVSLVVMIWKFANVRGIESNKVNKLRFWKKMSRLKFHVLWPKLCMLCKIWHLKRQKFACLKVDLSFFEKFSKLFGPFIQTQKWAYPNVIFQFYGKNQNQWLSFPNRLLLKSKPYLSTKKGLKSAPFFSLLL